MVIHLMNGGTREMGDFYTEQLVKRRASKGAVLVKAGLSLLTVLAFLSFFLFTPGILFLAVMIAVDIFAFRQLDLEFEYLYVNGDLDIDKIMAKQRRKKVFETNISELEILAPTGSAELNAFQKVKTHNFSTLEPDHKTYTMVIVRNGEKEKIIFEPNQIILDGMKMLAPRKVVL